MAGENAFKSREVSMMLKQGFISDQTLSVSLSRIVSIVYWHSSFSLSMTLSSPPLTFSPSTQSQAQNQIQTLPTQGQTIYEMMSDDQHRESKLSEDKRHKVQDWAAKALDEVPFGDLNWGGFVDVRLPVVSGVAFRVSMDVHKSVLAEKSRFFAGKLQRDQEVSHSVEISDCDDVEVYVETVVLVYFEDLKRRLMGEEFLKF